MFAPSGPPKPADALKSYAASGSGTVQGTKDRDKEIQIAFWERAAREGFTDERARTSAKKFRTEFDALDRRLAQHPYLMGDTPSVLDIAWFIYAHRLSLAGYPLARLHPRVSTWAEKLHARPEFSREIAMPPESATRLEGHAPCANASGKDAGDGGRVLADQTCQPLGARGQGGNSNHSGSFRNWPRPKLVLDVASPRLFWATTETGCCMRIDAVAAGSNVFKCAVLSMLLAVGCSRKRRKRKQPNGTLVCLGSGDRKLHLQLLHASAVHGDCMGEWRYVFAQSTPWV